MKYFTLTICILLLGCRAQKTSTADKDFEPLASTFLETFYDLNPEYASYLGLKAYDSILVLPTADHDAVYVTSYEALRDQMNAIDVADLSLDHKVELELIKNHIEQSLWYAQSFNSDQWDPSTYNVINQLGSVFINTDRTMEDRLRVISTYLKNVPEYYAIAKGNLLKPTKAHCELAILQIKGGMNTLESVADSARNSTLKETEKQILLDRIAAAGEALADYVDHLGRYLENQPEEAFRSFRIGDPAYAENYRLDINSGYDAAGIYQMALKRKEMVTFKMDSIADVLWPKYFSDPAPSDQYKKIKKMIDTLSVNHVKPGDFIQAIDDQISELSDFVNQHDLLTLDPKKPLKVRPTPEYQRGIAGASIDSPGPFEKERETYYNVTPLDGYSEEEAESYLREYNDYILQILNIHEAIPGHYVQLVYSNQSESLIKSIFGNGSMIEGWAVYAELMMLENGYKDTPEMWLMYYKWHLRSVVNTILDYSVHTLGMEKEEAIAMMTNEAFQQQAEAEGKWRRVTYTQVQLTSYYTGFQEIVDLREELKGKMGDDFDLKSFHEKFLSYGSIPVRFIRELMLEDLE